jgi:hypothetical protein
MSLITVFTDASEDWRAENSEHIIGFVKALTEVDRFTMEVDFLTDEERQ